MKRFFIESPHQTFWPYEHSDELHFVKQITRCADKIFSGYYGREWTPIVRDGWGRGAQPDMVLVSVEFDLWYVVEVELVHHSLLGHIQPQLETLSSGIYDTTLLPSLAAAVPEVPTERLRKLIYREPGLLCIANDYTEGIHSVCRELNFEFAVFEPYHSKEGAWAINVARLPSILSARAEAGRYEVRRGRKFGDREWLELPRHFPFWHGKLTIVDERGEKSDCQIFHGDRLSVAMPVKLLKPNVGVALIMIDRDRKILRLEIEP